MTLVNRRIVAQVRRSVAGTLDRRQVADALRQRLTQRRFEQDTGYFRAHRLWEAGNQRKATEYNFGVYLMHEELRTSERLRSEAVIESLRSFTSLEMAYLAECVQKAVEHKLQVPQSPEDTTRLQQLAGELTRVLPTHRTDRPPDPGGPEQAAVLSGADEGGGKQNGAGGGGAGGRGACSRGSQAGGGGAGEDQV